MAAIMIPEPHFISSESDFIDFVNELKKTKTLDKVATEAGLSRHTVRSAFEKGSAGKFSSVISVCNSMGYDVILARKRGEDEK